MNVNMFLQYTDYTLRTRRTNVKHKSHRAPCWYLEGFNVVLESLVLRLQVLQAMLGLTQLSLQLGLQLSAPLLELQQLLAGLLAAVRGRRERKVKVKF